MIEPKEVIINYDGEDYKFNISKFPATVGREIISKYPVSNLPKIGDYAVSEETMLKLMGYVERVYDDRTQPLTNKALVDNHVPNWEILAQLEMAMIQYNCSFFRNGKGLDFLKKLQSLAEPKITEMLTALSGKSSPQAKRAYTNSKRSTR